MFIKYDKKIISQFVSGIDKIYTNKKVTSLLTNTFAFFKYLNISKFKI